MQNRDDRDIRSLSLPLDSLTEVGVVSPRRRFPFWKDKVRSAEDLSPRRASSGVINTNIDKLKKLHRQFSLPSEEPSCYLNVFRFNKSGQPQKRILLLTNQAMYVITSKPYQLHRRVPLSDVIDLVVSSFWDELLCVHLKYDFDLVLVCEAKFDAIAVLQLHWSEQKLPKLGVTISDSVVVTLAPQVVRTVSFKAPDGRDSNYARLIVDLEELSEAAGGETAAQCLRSEAVYKPELEEVDEDPQVSGSLMNRLMKVVPSKKAKFNYSKAFGPTREQRQNYVYYKWLFSPDDWKLRPGLDAKAWQVQGNRDYMEDVFVIESNIPNELGNLLVCLFDGHGGKHASEFAGKRIKDIVEQNFNAKKNNNDPKKILFESLKQLQKEICEESWSSLCGTTALIGLIRNGVFHIVNVGDCRAIAISEDKTTRLTVDHKIVDPKESERITNLGGVIKNGRISVGNSEINLSRALGDRHFMPFISAEPDYLEMKIQPHHRFVAIACDGVWDVITDDNAADTLRKVPDPKRICTQAYSAGSYDNLSCIIVYFDPQREREYFERQDAIRRASTPTSSVATPSPDSRSLSPELVSPGSASDYEIY